MVSDADSGSLENCCQVERPSATIASAVADANLVGAFEIDL